MPIRELIAELKRQLLAEVSRMAFAIELADAIGYGEITLKVYNGKIKDVDIHIGAHTNVSG